MQPYFFPYVGYFSLIKHSDKFIIFDTVQFIRHGWIERNRILKPGEGWQYIQVPLIKHSRETLINEVEIKNIEPWKEKIKAQLQHYKKRAPFFNECMNLIDDCLSIETDNIAKLNKHILASICNYLGIKFDCEIFSEMNLVIDEVKEADEWALNISKALNAKEYINPPGGMDFFNRDKYHNHNIQLTFMGNNVKEYNQRRALFEGGLSIIDLIMFNNIESINIMIDDFKII